MEKRPVNFQGTFEESQPEIYPWWNELEVIRRAKGKGQKTFTPKLPKL